MSFAVFNIANVDSSIRAAGPNVRLLGLGLGKGEADALSKGRAIETRVWPMSSGPTSADGAGLNVLWRPVSNLKLSSLDAAATEAALAAEYASIGERAAAWQAWREAADADVAMAAREHVLRPVYQVRAEMLLATGKSLVPEAIEVRPEFLEPVSPKSPSAPGAPRANKSTDNETTADEAFTVPKWSRDDEITGQTWALVAIIGDAKYEKAKSDLLDALGRKYFEYIKVYTEQEDETLAERHWHEAMASEEDAIKAECETALKLFVAMEVWPAQRALEALVEEPMVAFFSASEDPEGLNKQAETLSKSADLKHADIAVVRMYSWLALRAAKSHRIKHVCRGSKQAADFFETMRSATF